MQRAREVVENNYAVVGVLEEMEKSLTVFENYIPRFFDGAKQIYFGKNFLQFCILAVKSGPFSRYDPTPGV